MSLSDCEKCWDTPCECGNYVYMVLRTSTPEEYKRLQELPRETFDKLKTFLQTIMQAALKPVVLPTSGVEIPTVDVDIKVVPLGKAETRCFVRDSQGRQCTKAKHPENEGHFVGPVCAMCN